jgi:hypothetical protein
MAPQWGNACLADWSVDEPHADPQPAAEATSAAVAAAAATAAAATATRVPLYVVESTVPALPSDHPERNHSRHVPRHLRRPASTSTSAPASDAREVRVRLVYAHVQPLGDGHHCEQGDLRAGLLT